MINLHIYGFSLGYFPTFIILVIARMSWILSQYIHNFYLYLILPETSWDHMVLILQRLDISHKLRQIVSGRIWIWYYLCFMPEAIQTLKHYIEHSGTSTLTWWEETGRSVWLTSLLLSLSLCLSVSLPLPLFDNSWFQASHLTYLSFIFPLQNMDKLNYSLYLRSSFGTQIM